MLKLPVERERESQLVLYKLEENRFITHRVPVRTGSSPIVPISLSRRHQHVADCVVVAGRSATPSRNNSRTHSQWRHGQNEEEDDDDE